jgi:hypothetical protein
MGGIGEVGLRLTLVLQLTFSDVFPFRFPLGDGSIVGTLTLKTGRRLPLQASRHLN